MENTGSDSLAEGTRVVVNGECVAVATTEARACANAADLVRQHPEKGVQMKPTTHGEKEPRSQPGSKGTELLGGRASW